MKRNVYKMVIHGLEKVALTKRQEEEMEVEEVKIFIGSDQEGQH